MNNIIHISGADKKFIFPLIEILNNEDDKNLHHKVIIPNLEHKDIEYFLSKNIITPSIRDSRIRLIKYLLFPFKTVQYFFILFKEINKSEKIFIHGLFDKKLILFFSLFPKLNQKCSWLIWGGGDLNIQETFSSNPFKKLIVRVKGNFKEYLTYIEEDFIDILTFYPIKKGKLSYNLLYLSNTCPKKLNPSRAVNEIYKVKNILVGHSADHEGEHLSTFKKIIASKLNHLSVHCILSYGEKLKTPNYVNKVIKEGKKHFNDFNPITRFMPFNEYVELINSMDILVLHHRYQQAMGNIILGLFLNKVIVLNESANHYFMLKRLGFEIISLDEFLSDTYKLDPQNKKLAESLFNYKILVSNWKKALYENSKYYS